MIENLNTRTFMQHGAVFEDTEHFLDMVKENALVAQELDTSGDAPLDGFVYMQHAVAVDYVEGMAALCVLAEDGKAAQVYYLDKPVLLKAGRPFRILSIGEACNVRLFLPQGEALMDYPSAVPCPPLSLEPSLRIDRIHTFFLQEKPKGFYFRGEKHGPYELTYVDRGTIHCIAGGTNYTLSQNDILICLPGQWHIQYADPDVSAAFVTVSFDMRCPQADALGGRVFRATSGNAHCLKAMLEEQQMPGRYSADKMIQLLEQLVLALLDAPRKGSKQRHDAITERNENRLVDEGLRFIEKNLTRPLTVAEVAAAVCISPSYLAVLFGRHLQMTPIATIRKLKLEESRRLIHQGDMTISQVAQHLGFATLQHFSRCFKEYFGIGPREYARTL